MAEGPKIEGGQTENAGHAQAKKRYTPPALRPLGTVRQLTLAGGKTVFETGRGHQKM